MKRILILIFTIYFFIGCNNPIETSTTATSMPSASPTPEISNNETENSDEKYPGVSIDETFPVIEDYPLSTDEKPITKTYTFQHENYEIRVKEHFPKELKQNGATLLKFKAEQDYYWSSSIGISKLLGENNKQFYFVNTGSGGICCTNYWIVDVSSDKPREIYRTEDYKMSLGDPIEIFDIDNHGIYEIEQGIYSFRYFMDDCGSCSPQPRAVLKYNKNLGKYVPAKDIMQPFVKESFELRESEIIERHGKIDIDKEPQKYLEYSKNVISVTLDLIYLGKEKKAWKFFNKYCPDSNYKEKARKEIKRRLAYCGFYQALYKR